MHLLLQDPSRRSIHFISDPVGNSGKSDLARLLSKDPKYKAIIAPSLSSPERYTSALIAQLAAYRDSYGSHPKTIIFDLAKSEDDTNIDSLYPILEHIKDGRLDSTFYGKFTRVEFPSPHVLVLTNSVPNLGALSTDRFNLYTITGESYNYSLVMCDANPEKQQMNRGLVSWRYKATPKSWGDQVAFYSTLFQGLQLQELLDPLGWQEGQLFSKPYYGNVRTSTVQRAPEYIKRLVIDTPTKN